MSDVASAAAPAVRSGPGGGLGRNLGLGFASLLVLLVVWEGVVRAGLVQPLFLPAPSAIFERGSLMLAQGTLVGHILASARRVMVGFLLASLTAIPLGIVLGASPTAMAIFNPILSFLRPLPSMSWVPLSLLWFGISETQKYSIVFMGAFAPSLLYVIEATRRVDPLLIRAAQNLGAKKMDLMFGVILPSALPQIIAGLKVMLGIAWTCVISAELVAAREGLGFMIMNGKEYFQTDTVMLGMVLISLTVMGTDILLRWLEKKVLPWVD